MDLAAVDPVLIAIGAGALLLLLLALALLLVRRRRRRLRATYGAEYQQAVDRTGSHRAAARELGERDQRRTRFELEPISVGDREQLRGRFQHIQASFVDDPAVAVDRAAEVVEAGARRRGYPDDGRERLLVDLSADHPAEVETYRQGLERRARSRSKRASTEDLRRTLLAARELLDAMLSETDVAPGSSSTALFRSIEDDATGRR